MTDTGRWVHISAAVGTEGVKPYSEADYRRELRRRESEGSRAE